MRWPVRVRISKPVRERAVSSSITCLGAALGRGRTGTGVRHAPPRRQPEQTAQQGSYCCHGLRPPELGQLGRTGFDGTLEGKDRDTAGRHATVVAAGSIGQERNELLQPRVVAHHQQPFHIGTVTYRAKQCTGVAS